MDDSKSKVLPLPGPPPKRSLTPPERRKATSFTLESDTPARNPTAAQFAALASVFDALTPEQRVDFVEFGFLFRGLDATDRKRLIDEAIKMNGLE